MLGGWVCRVFVYRCGTRRRSFLVSDAVWRYTDIRRRWFKWVYIKDVVFWCCRVMLMPSLFDWRLYCYREPYTSRVGVANGAHDHNYSCSESRSLMRSLGASHFFLLHAVCLPSVSALMPHSRIKQELCVWVSLFLWDLIALGFPLLVKAGINLKYLLIENTYRSKC